MHCFLHVFTNSFVQVILVFFVLILGFMLWFENVLLEMTKWML